MLYVYLDSPSDYLIYFDASGWSQGCAMIMSHLDFVLSAQHILSSCSSCGIRNPSRIWKTAMRPIARYCQAGIAAYASVSCILITDRRFTSFACRLSPYELQPTAANLAVLVDSVTESLSRDCCKLQSSNCKCAKEIFGVQSSAEPIQDC